jgi:hypothetical protein
LQKPPLQVRVQQSPVLVHAPPIGTQLSPLGAQLPFWHSPLQQSASRLHGGALMHRCDVASQLRPVPQLIVEQS